MSEFDTVIRNGVVVTASETVEADVGIKNGKIVDLGVSLGDADQMIDARNKFVLPGGIDSHVHIDEPVRAIAHLTCSLLDPRHDSKVHAGSVAGSQISFIARHPVW
jgi:N-acyl-D-aspartate/D-glutamate deacylase